MRVIDGIVVFDSAEQSLLEHTETQAFSGMTIKNALDALELKISIRPTGAIDYVNKRILERLAQRSGTSARLGLEARIFSWMTLRTLWLV